MHLSHPVVEIILAFAGGICLLCSNVIFWDMLNEVNSKRPPAQRFGFFLMNSRVSEIKNEHARLFPQSKKRKLTNIWTLVGFGLFALPFLFQFA